MSVDIIANYTVTNPEKYAEYPMAAMPTVVQYGGKMLVGTDEVHVLGGNPSPTFVVIEFESVEAVQRWYNSPEYTKVKHLREENSEGWGVIAPQFEMPQS